MSNPSLPQDEDSFIQSLLPIAWLSIIALTVFVLVPTTPSGASAPFVSLTEQIQQLTAFALVLAWPLLLATTWFIGFPPVRQAIHGMAAAAVGVTGLLADAWLLGPSHPVISLFALFLIVLPVSFAAYRWMERKARQKVIAR